MWKSLSPIQQKAVESGLPVGAVGAEALDELVGEAHRLLTLAGQVGVSDRTLIIAASHSGETAETLSGFGAARERGLPIAVITTGGRLAAQATQDGLPLLEYRLAGQPRAAIFFGVGLVHELL